MQDQIYSSIPVDKTAALVTGVQPNDETNKNNYGDNYISLIRPPVLPFFGNQQYLDLRGLSFGKLVVIGIFIKQTPRKKIKWVVQCKCGYYLIRISPTIRRKIKNKEYDECARCRVSSKRYKPNVI